MQTPPEGTVPVGKLGADSPDWKVRVAGRKVKSARQFHTGQVNGVYQNRVPYSLTKADLERGQDRYGIYCTPCHGIAGFGNGTVADRSRGKLKPTNFHDTPGECTPKSAVAAKLKNLERLQRSFRRLRIQPKRQLLSHRPQSPQRQPSRRQHGKVLRHSGKRICKPTGRWRKSSRTLTMGAPKATSV